MPTKHPFREAIIWNTLSYDYLLIAHKMLFREKVNKRIIESQRLRHAVIISAVFSFLTVDGTANYLWLMEDGQRQYGTANPATHANWKEIDSEKKWIRKKMDERLNHLSLSVTGKDFFEPVAPRPCHDLFCDYWDLRNALFHATPDMTRSKKRVLESEVRGEAVFTKSEHLVREPKVPKGRQRHSNLSLRLSPWISIGDISGTHALEVFKITLAVLHRLDRLFQMPFQGVDFGNGLLDFRSAFRELPACHFDNILTRTWDL